MSSSFQYGSCIDCSLCFSPVRTEPPGECVLFNLDTVFGKSGTALILDVQGSKKSPPASSEVDTRARSQSPKIQKRKISLRPQNAAPVFKQGYLAVGHRDRNSRASSASSGVFSGSEEDLIATGSVDVLARDDRNGKRLSSRHMNFPEVNFEPKHRREDSSGMLGTVVDFLSNVGRFLQVGTQTVDTSVDDDVSVSLKKEAARLAAAAPKEVKYVEAEKTVSIDLPEEGQLLRVQRTPIDFMKKILDHAKLPSEDLKALVKQPTTLFVSDESFPSLRGKQEGLYKAYVTIELAERSKSVQPSDHTPAPTVMSPTTNGMSSKTPSVRTSSENPFSAGRKISDTKKDTLPDERDSVVVATGRLFVCDSSRITHVARDHVVMHDAMRRFLGAAATVCVRIKTLSHKDSKVQGMCLRPLLDNVSDRACIVDYVG